MYHVHRPSMLATADSRGSRHQPVERSEPGHLAAAIRVGAGLHLPPPISRERVARGRVPDVDSNAADQPEHSPLEPDPRELSDIPSIEVISRAGLMLLSAAAERLGLSSDDPENSPHRDLDEARRLITALAGLITASGEYLGAHAAPLRDGLQSMQRAFREASDTPDEPGNGPGERYTGPVR